MRIAENFNTYLNNPSYYDCVNIPVDGSPESDLFFEGLESKVQKVLKKDKKVCIEVFLDLHDQAFSFYNDFEISTRRRSLEVLLEIIEKFPKQAIEHIILYRGSLDFSNFIQNNVEANNHYFSWKKDLLENTIDEEHLLHLFSTQLLSEFFHSISSIFPDHINRALIFNTPPNLEFGKTAELISSETFSHLHIGIRNPKFFVEGISWGSENGSINLLSQEKTKSPPVDVKTAVVLPFLGLCNYNRFEQVCNLLNKNNIPFKIIEENLINDKWFNIDHILFDHETISYDGRRMLEGFLSAGGKIYSFESKKCYEDSIISNFSSLESLVKSTI